MVIVAAEAKITATIGVGALVLVVHTTVCAPKALRSCLRLTVAIGGSARLSAPAPSAARPFRCEPSMHASPCAKTVTGAMADSAGIVPRHFRGVPPPRGGRYGKGPRRAGVRWQKNISPRHRSRVRNACVGSRPQWSRRPRSELDARGGLRRVKGGRLRMPKPAPAASRFLPSCCHDNTGLTHEIA